MLKTMIEKIEKVVKGKLNKSKIQEKIEKHSNYFLKAKEIWNMINVDLGISNTVENKFISKVEKFEKTVLAKFPELTKEDVIELRKNIIGGVNARKEAVLNQVDHLNIRLKEENEKLKEQLSKFSINQNLNTDKILEEELKTATEEKNKEENK